VGRDALALRGACDSMAHPSTHRGVGIRLRDAGLLLVILVLVVSMLAERDLAARRTPMCQTFSAVASGLPGRFRRRRAE
jgi:hypothetical protein